MTQQQKEKENANLRLHQQQCQDQEKSLFLSILHLKYCSDLTYNIVSTSVHQILGRMLINWKVSKEEQPGKKNL